MSLDDFLSVSQSLLGIVWVRVVLTVVIAAVVHAIARTFIVVFVRRLVEGSRKIKRRKISVEDQKRVDTLTSLFRTASMLVIWVVAFFMILRQVGVDIAAVMTGAGLLGLIVGFGAQSAVKDFLAGVSIIVENQYRVGDIVTLVVGGKEVSGVVEDLTIRITKMRDLDGKLHFVPNGSSQVVTNHTFEYANVNVDIGVSYEADIDKIERVINDVGTALAGDKDWKKDIIEPIQFLRVDAFDDSSVRIKSLGKVLPSKQWAVAGEFRRRLKRAFDEEGVTIPFPQIVVHGDWPKGSNDS